jgi:hypothetical protein
MVNVTVACGPGNQKDSVQLAIDVNRYGIGKWRYRLRAEEAGAVSGYSIRPVDWQMLSRPASRTRRSRARPASRQCFELVQQRFEQLFALALRAEIEVGHGIRQR